MEYRIVISVLIPSRKRPLQLLESIRSLGDGDFEVLVRLDDDDDSEYLLPDGVEVVTGPRHSYRQLHKYYNELSEISMGDWLFLWNDDVRMETYDWVDKIKGFDHTQPLVLSPYHPVDNLFPLISRKFYEIIGHYSLNTHCDSWVQMVGNATGTQVHVPGIHISHRAPAIIGDLDDLTYRESREALRESSPEFNSPQMQALREKDIQKIRDWQNENARKMSSR